MAVTVAVDAMSGDRGWASPVAAIKEALATDPELQVLLVGRKDELASQLPSDRVEFLDAPEVISMADEPLKVLRNRKSSMFKAVEAVADGHAGAAVSAGNTGALMGMARIQLKMMEGFHRPAIAGFIPCQRCTSSFCMLDLGANVDRDASMLVSFAYLGEALYRAVTDEPRPRVALLNIGEENIKGGDEILEAFDRLQRSSLNFIGNVEANALYEKPADVVVCDGFTGNVILKSMEGLSGMIKGIIMDAYGKNLVTKVGAVVSTPVINDLRRIMDPRGYSGAVFLGLRGLVVKTHGNSDEVAFLASIRFAAKQVRNELISHIQVHGAQS